MESNLGLPMFRTRDAYLKALRNRPPLVPCRLLSHSVEPQVITGKFKHLFGLTENSSFAKTSSYRFHRTNPFRNISLNGNTQT